MNSRSGSLVRREGLALRLNYCGAPDTGVRFAGVAQWKRSCCVSLPIPSAVLQT